MVKQIRKKRMMDVEIKFLNNAQTKFVSYAVTERKNLLSNCKITNSSFVDIQLADIIWKEYRFQVKHNP